MSKKKETAAAPKAAPKAETKAAPTAETKVAPKAETKAAAPAPKAAAPAPKAASAAMTKRDLINAVSEKAAAAGVTLNKTQITQIVSELFEAIKGEIAASAKYQQPRFGTFEVRERKARTGRSPKGGAPIEIPASKSVGLKVSKLLKDSLN
jgi:DNA-binding protein HU-beta